MIYEFFTGKKVSELNKCDMCKYNIGYTVKDKTTIWCDKKQKYEKNNKGICRDNTFKEAEVKENED